MHYPVSYECFSESAVTDWFGHISCAFCAAIWRRFTPIRYGSIRWATASVFWYSFWIKFGLFAGFFAATLAILRGAFSLLERAYRDFVFGDTVIPFENQPIEVKPERFLKPLARGVAFVWSFVNALAMAGRWELFALYFNGKAGQNPDPIFGKSLGFFLFAWPVHQIVASWLVGLTVIVLAAALLYGGLVFLSRMPNIIKREALQTATASCSLALAGVLVVYAWRVYLGRFTQLWRDHDVFTGAGYTEAKIILPGQLLIAYLLLGARAVAIVNAVKWRHPRVLFWAPGIPFVAYVALGLVGNYVGNFIVKPNELERQSPYIKHNIEGTRRAFGLGPHQHARLSDGARSWPLSI